MDDVKGFVKKYWPYIVGGLIGLYLLLRYSSGGSSSGDGGAGNYAAMLQAQSQAAQQAAALAAQTAAAQAADATNNKALDIANNKNYADAFNNFQLTQSEMAKSLGSSASQVIAALNTPAVTAMQASAVENAAALEAAGNVVANSFLAQGGVVASSNALAGSLAGTLGEALQGIANIGKKSPSQIPEAINAVANAYSAYATGGMSGAFGGGGGYVNRDPNQSTLGGAAFGNNKKPAGWA